MPGLTNAIASYLLEALQVALSRLPGPSKVFRISSSRGNSELCLELPAPEPRALSAWQNLHSLIEAASTALSLVVARQEYNLNCVERSRKDTGIDYWLAPSELAVDNLDWMTQPSAMEISAIWSGGSRAIDRRIKEKSEKISGYSNSLLRGALLSVVHFESQQVVLRKLGVEDSGRTSIC